MKAVVIREGDSRTTIIELPDPIGVVQRIDPDMDYMTDEQLIKLTVKHQTGLIASDFTLVPSDDLVKVRYTFTVDGLDEVAS